MLIVSILLASFKTKTLTNQLSRHIGQHKVVTLVLLPLQREECPGPA